MTAFADTGETSAQGRRASELRSEIARLQQELESVTSASALPEDMAPRPLKRSEYRRYGRQMILDGFGLPAQLKLKDANLLVIGAGGLGCPVLLYLAAAGHLTIVDHDIVEVSNLHRQVLHTQGSVGEPKVLSAVRAIKERNSAVQVTPLIQALTPTLLASLSIDSFDLILDCSDNARTRYLLNDACVAHGKTLVSGAAIRLDGQLVCWNLPSLPGQQERGPCYRCVFPADDLDKTDSQNCEDEGVLGTVTGVIGCMMAGEAVRLLTSQHDHQPLLTLYSGFSNPPFRSVKIRGKKQRCLACSTLDGAQQLLQLHRQAEVDGRWVIESCGIGQNAPLAEERITVDELDQRLQQGSAVLVDVRSAAEFSIASLPGSQNVPLNTLDRSLDQLPLDTSTPLLTVCRRGNDSLLAARSLAAKGYSVRDVAGGLRAWSAHHSDFPSY